MFLIHENCFIACQQNAFIAICINIGICFFKEFRVFTSLRIFFMTSYFVIYFKTLEYGIEVKIAVEQFKGIIFVTTQEKNPYVQWNQNTIPNPHNHSSRSRTYTFHFHYNIHKIYKNTTYMKHTMYYVCWRVEHIINTCL